MMAMTLKQNADDPAASPSSPSVRLTALDVPTRTKVANATQPHCPSCHPGESDRVNERVVAVCAQCTASSATSTETAIWAPDLARLLRPRLRLWRTLIQS